MSDHQAFLRGIIARPDDDTPRRIYGDFLREHGDDARADFIDVQCELAANWEIAQYHPDCADLDCEWAALRRRERELLAVHGESWSLREIVRPAGIEVGGPRRWLSAEGIRDTSVPSGQERASYRPGQLHRPPVLWAWQYHRGFISEITCRWEDFARHADAILAACPIRRRDVAPRRICTACDGDGLSTGPPECRKCRRCDGRGSLPAEKPDWRGDGKVILTTWPNIRARQPNQWATPEGIPSLLAGLFPGIHFELPTTTWQEDLEREEQYRRQALRNDALDALSLAAGVHRSR